MKKITQKPDELTVVLDLCDEDERAERIRANADAELSIMKEASRKRQEAAEALAEAYQEDRREA
ncbi:hypothetical protein GO730_20865 [Spirosoma sp. HMF3257]|uniref:Uncharacterized protein n=1 Tax=Spirosoma telluris TaxID=2183553 RepID=A0A327NKV0_9BACT|nr:hypothetical protein [Spirosoma telluris]RAI76000.1 hypothetical protein HMF3257_20790 [Spirosoma telluris]